MTKIIILNIIGIMEKNILGGDDGWDNLLVYAVAIIRHTANRYRLGGWM